MSEKKWYVYLLCDPDTEDPFYVGKGSGNRINTHDNCHRTDTNKRKKYVIQSIHAAGKEVLKKKVAEFDSEQDAYIYEWATINVYQEHLTNLCSGGLGGASKPRRKGSNRKDPMVIEDGLVKAAIAANLLGVSSVAIVEMAGRGEIPSYRIRSSLRFMPSEVIAFRSQIS